MEPVFVRNAENVAFAPRHVGVGDSFISVAAQRPGNGGVDIVPGVFAHVARVLVADGVGGALERGAKQIVSFAKPQLIVCFADKAVRSAVKILIASVGYAFSRNTYLKLYIETISKHIKTHLRALLGKKD